MITNQRFFVTSALGYIIGDLNEKLKSRTPILRRFVTDFYVPWDVGVANGHDPDGNELPAEFKRDHRAYFPEDYMLYNDFSFDARNSADVHLFPERKYMARAVEVGLGNLRPEDALNTGKIPGMCCMAIILVAKKDGRVIVRLGNEFDGFIFDAQQSDNVAVLRLKANPRGTIEIAQHVTGPKTGLIDALQEPKIDGKFSPLLPPADRLLQLHQFFADGTPFRGRDGSAVRDQAHAAFHALELQRLPGSFTHGSCGHAPIQQPSVRIFGRLFGFSGRGGN